jgi:hypothetical protein
MAKRFHLDNEELASPSLRGGAADEAIQGRQDEPPRQVLLDCFASLAMTVGA